LERLSRILLLAAGLKGTPYPQGKRGGLASQSIIEAAGIERCFFNQVSERVCEVGEGFTAKRIQKLFFDS
jgi:hypothetical protein